MPLEAPHPNQHKILELVEKLVALMLDSQGRIKEKLVVFIGAGCSYEYGVPTTLELARKFLLSEKGGLSVEERAAIEHKHPEEIFDLFLEKFHHQNTITIEYAFFQELVEEARKSCAHPPLTYEMLADLWVNGYIDLVITTNFDALIEETTGRQATILDYNDIKNRNFPESQDNIVLIKIAGDIKRSSMLWSSRDFASCLSDTVIQWLSSRISHKPLVTIGYRAAEKEVAQLLLQHEREMFVVLPGSLSQSENMVSIARLKKGGPAYHLDTTAGAFLEAATERIYERSQDKRLAYSFQNLRDKIKGINGRYSDMPDDRLFVERGNLQGKLDSFLKTSLHKERVLILLGESGHGKSYYLKHLAQKFEDDAAIIYIAASEVPQGVLGLWFDRLQGITLDKLCTLCTSRCRKLVCILDGLNEVEDTFTALGLLAEVTAVIDKHNDPNIKFIIASRPDFWHNLTDRLHRADYENILWVSPYTEVECSQGLRKLGISFSLDQLERHSAREIIAIPAYQSILRKLRVKRLEHVTSERLFEQLFQLQIERKKAANRVVHRLCRSIATAQSSIVRDFPEGMRAEDQEAFDELIASKVLYENSLGKTSFRFDTFGEYAFAKVYLHDDLYSEYLINATESRVVSFLKDRLSEWRSIPASRLGFKILFLNALRYFVLLLQSPEIASLLTCGDPGIEQIAKDALYLRRYVDFSPAFLDDPALLCISLLKRKNYANILSELKSEDNRFAFKFPLNIAGKLFPDYLVRFTEFALYRTIRDLVNDPYPRTSLNIVCNLLIIHIMRNGPPDRKRHRRLLLLLSGLVARLDKDFLASKLEESIHENSPYLLYSDHVAKINDIVYIPAVYKEILTKAITTNAFCVEYPMLAELIRYNMVTWLVMMFLLLRDRDIGPLEPMVDRLIESGELRLQDFGLTLYGHLSKMERQYERRLKYYTFKMKENSPTNFYKMGIDGDSPDSQYDPLVPYVSTHIINNRPSEIELPAPEISPEYLTGLSRLFYKFAVDFPDETLRTIYRIKSKLGVDIYKLWGSTLKTVQRLHPEIFWSITRTFNIDDCFSPEFDKITYEPRSIQQVRDWDWFRVFRYILDSAQRSEKVGEILKKALAASSFHSLLLQLVDSYDNRNI